MSELDKIASSLLLSSSWVPGGDGLENSIPLWPPAGLIEPKGSIRPAGGGGCAIYQGIRGITAFPDVAMPLDWLAD